MNFIDRYEDQLLVAATERSKRTARRRRLRLPALGFGGVLAAGVGAAAILLTPAGDRLTPVQQAVAALGRPGELVHFEMEQIFSAKGVKSPDCDIAPTEAWMATSGDARIHLRTTAATGPDCGGYGTLADGTPRVGTIDESFGADGSVTTYVPALRRGTVVTDERRGQPFTIDLTPGDGSFIGTSDTATDPQAQLRSLLSDRGLRDEGVSIKDGRSVRTFVLPEPKERGDDPGRPKNGTFTYVVDAKTFAPISVVRAAAEIVPQPGGKPNEYIQTKRGLRFLRWDRLVLDEAGERLLSVDFPPGTAVARGTAKHFYQAPRAVRLRREREGKALYEEYERQAVQRQAP